MTTSKEVTLGCGQGPGELFLYPPEEEGRETGKGKACLHNKNTEIGRGRKKTVKQSAIQKPMLYEKRNA